jgi:hypothetical protein
MVFLEQAPEGMALLLSCQRRLGHITAMQVQDLGQVMPFKLSDNVRFGLLHGDGTSGLHWRLQVIREILERNDSPVTHEKDLLDDICQLAHISGPSIVT